MSDRHHLSSCNRLDVTDKRRDVVGPLRPRVNVAARSGAVAVTAQVERVRAHAVLRHSSGKPLIPAGVLTKSMYDCEREGARLRPGTVDKPGAIGRCDRT